MHSYKGSWLKLSAPSFCGETVEKSSTDGRTDSDADLLERSKSPWLRQLIVDNAVIKEDDTEQFLFLYISL